MNVNGATFLPCDISPVTNEESIKQSIRNIVLTAPGEKLFNPKFGSSVYKMLFEPLDPFMIVIFLM